MKIDRVVLAGALVCGCAFLGAGAVVTPVPALAGASTVGTGFLQHRAAALVTGVADGDTLYVELDGESTRVRLAQIDAPEKRQPFGRRAEQSLRELVGKRVVSLSWRSVDRYGRPVVQIVADGVDVNAEQVRLGYAWVYLKYANDPGLLKLEREARAAKRGLWADPSPVEPWLWRKGSGGEGDRPRMR